MEQVIDKARVAAAFGRAARSYEQHNGLQRVSGEALLALLPQARQQCGLDLGCGSGFFLPILRPKVEQLLALDLSADMLEQAQKKADIVPICADMDSLPLVPNSLDWIFANLCLQWSADPAAWLQGWSERLKPGGVLVFSTLLDGSLQELAQAWRAVDDHPHINRFTTRERLQELLDNCGRQARLTVAEVPLSYTRVKDLLLDLKGIGANQVNGERRTGLLGKAGWQRLNLAYPKNTAGQYVASYRLAYGVIYG
ncbi:malonyl-ACP O-methyltransferase BioC [Zobellella maritima]|uniref:malonyl-ACP O-methyltransferase BioC n=1 Tax=Zobellella maritima TaxID=2059725 RepID=UPI000E2FF93E|nr:malonyl-ACP O-methyltransferase BioC [Zobellella maritima]